MKFDMKGLDWNHWSGSYGDSLMEVGNNLANGNVDRLCRPRISAIFEGQLIRMGYSRANATLMGSRLLSGTTSDGRHPPAGLTVFYNYCSSREDRACQDAVINLAMLIYQAIEGMSVRSVGLNMQPAYRMIELDSEEAARQCAHMVNAGFHVWTRMAINDRDQQKSVFECFPSLHEALGETSTMLVNQHSLTERTVVIRSLEIIPPWEHEAQEAPQRPRPSVG